MKKEIYGEMNKDYFRVNYLSKEYRKEKKKNEEENEGKLQ